MKKQFTHFAQAYLPCLPLLAVLNLMTIMEKRKNK